MPKSLEQFKRDNGAAGNDLPANSKLTQIMTVISILNADSTYGYGQTVAAAFVAMIPPLIIFVVVQKYIRDGIQLTGVK